MADQYTKWMAVSFLFQDGPHSIGDFETWFWGANTLYQPILVEISPYLNLVMVWNFGVSFGIFNTGTDTFATALIAISLLICFFLVIWLWRTYALFTTILLGCVIGGALGNIYDRARFGAVIDFLDFHYEGFHWPAFNLADTAITVSVMLLIINQIFSKDIEEDY